MVVVDDVARLARKGRRKVGGRDERDGRDGRVRFIDGDGRQTIAFRRGRDNILLSNGTVYRFATSRWLYRNIDPLDKIDDRGF